jgi:hypothetical protein
VGCNTGESGFSLWQGQSSNLLLTSPAQSFLLSGPVGTHDHIFFLSKTFMCFEMGLPLRLEDLVFLWLFWAEKYFALAFGSAVILDLEPLWNPWQYVCLFQDNLRVSKWGLLFFFERKGWSLSLGTGLPALTQTQIVPFCISWPALEHPVSYPGALATLLLGGKRPRSETNHSTLSNTGYRMSGDVPPLFHMSSWHGS